jgi:hypothetical protein
MLDPNDLDLQQQDEGVLPTQTSHSYSASGR